MRGAQLAVVRRLQVEGQHVMIAIHRQLLGWIANLIAKRLGAYENNKNQNKKETTILFFGVLQSLLAPLDNRDALAIYVPLTIFETSLINLLYLAKLTWTKCSLRP
jgi:cohesin complex subunit SA-1/2